MHEQSMPDPYRIAVVPAFPFQALAADRMTPEQLLGRVSRAGHEGLIAKLRTSKYSPGQRPDFWLKHPLIHPKEVVVCGWRPGQNRLAGTLGGLLLGAQDPDTGNLVYIGDVGTGFSERERTDLQAGLHSIERARIRSRSRRRATTCAGHGQSEWMCPCEVRGVA
nr:hypothetical protein [Kibdelosporangium phytohabitans]